MVTLYILITSWFRTWSINERV